MSKLQDKLKNNRTRPAEIMGESVFIKVYSGKEWLKILKRLEKMKEKEVSEFISDQILDEFNKPVLTAEFLRSDDCPNCAGIEIMTIIRDVNSGIYGKNL